MPNYICDTECYFRDRRWKPGEPLASKPGEVVPHHFSEVNGGAARSSKQKPQIEEPKTLLELQNREARAMLIGDVDSESDLLS
jgi:hypothetical protein